MNSADTEGKIRKKRKQKKAPQAPKKALTPYIFFSQEIRPQVKADMPEGTKVTDIVRVIAEKWSAMTEEQKRPYVKMAEEDKIRYSQQINSYDGPLHVPVNKKRGKQNRTPGAPKRAMSPFLFFSNEKRGEIQENNPNMKITQVSSKLGEIWRSMTNEEKQPYIEKSKEDRNRYKMQQNEFKGKHPQPEKKPTTVIPTSVAASVTPQQWSLPVGESNTNSVNFRMYDIQQSAPPFTNISIPMGFNS